MLHEKDFLAPLDPDLMIAFAGKVDKAVVDESSDMWALGKFIRHNNSLLSF